MKTIYYFILILVIFVATSCQTEKKTGEWQSIFNGENLDGWKTAGENPESITVENGTIKCSGERSHLFYKGNFKNFEFETEVKSLEHSNSGIFIHTKYQAEGWPSAGYEIQINNSYKGIGNYIERKKTGSIYSIRNIYYQFVNDNEWFKMQIKVVDNFIEVFINDIKVNEYIQPENSWRWEGACW
jgi:hypothetical protein